MANRTLRGPDLGGEADLSLPAGLIGHPARTAILLALLDGRALPMSVLAAEAGVAGSTASAHLGRLTSAGLLRVVPQGRYRYYRIASAEVAEALEALARIAPPAPVSSLRAAGRAAELRFARTCYDHIAGLLGVALMRSLIDRGALAGGDGRHQLEIGRPGPAVRARPRPGLPAHRTGPAAAGRTGRRPSRRATGR